MQINMARPMVCAQEENVQMLALRPFVSEDLPLLTKWLYTPHVAKWYHDPLDWIAEVQQREGVFRWIHHYIVEYDGVPIGFCQYYACQDSGEQWGGYTIIDGAYSIDYLIGETAHLGRGLGKGTVHALIDAVQMHSDAKRIVAQPEPENSASRGTLLSCGFFHVTENDVFVLPLNSGNR